LFAYVIASFFANVEWSQALLRTFIPDFDFSQNMIFMVVAILGTTISPYLFFWQTSEEVEEEIASGKTTVTARASATAAELRSMRRDVGTGMLLSNAVMFFIIVTTAATLHQNGITAIDTAADAAEALRPLAGNASFFLFTLGILGTGLLAIPVLAGSASYAIAEVFGWREGLGNSFSKAKPFYLTMAAAVIIGMSMNAFGISPLTFLLIAAVVNGLVAPVLLWFIVRMADRRDVVGEHVSPPAVRWLGWSAFVLMSLAGSLLIIQSLMI
ncbi:MAG: divalent metal cation transporter, partial [Candidatus Kerfeldbacteria bacterium]|nr:divalent metal cation transporter [Candidatus Kerfeldbacteria bacterium]